MSVNEAAPILKMDRKTLMRWIRNGTCPFGAYIKGESGAKDHYHIFSTRMAAYIAAEDMRPICPYTYKNIEECFRY